MTNATKTLAVLFAGTLLLALATSWSWSSTSSAAFQETLVAVDTSAVQAIQIERARGPAVRLHRSNGGWSIAPSDTSAHYPARAEAVRQLLGTLPSLEVSAVPTRQPEKHPRYGVDSTGTTVTLLGAAEEPLGQLIVGRTRVRRPQQSGGQSQRALRRRQRRGTPITYVRSPDRPDVYSVERSLRSFTSRSVEDWREKQLWGLARTDIQRVDLRYPADSSLTLRRVAPTDSAASRTDAWVSAGDTLSQSSVSSLLRVLSSPRADGFAETMTPDAFGPAQYTVRLHLSDGTQRSIRLRPGPGGDQYLAVADGFPYVVELRKGTWDRSVLQGRSALLTDN